MWALVAQIFGVWFLVDFTLMVVEGPSLIGWILDKLGW